MVHSEEAMMMIDQDHMFVMEEEEDDDHHHPNNLSRLSMCTTTRSLMPPPHKLDDDDDDDDNNNNGGSTMTMYMSRLSIESFDDGDADEEFSDEKEGQHMLGGLSSDSDKEQLQLADCYSLPGTPRPAQRKNQLLAAGVFKEYASENEVVQKGLLRKKMTRRYRLNRRRMVTRETWAERSTNWDINMSSSASTTTNNNNNIFSCSGESDQGGAGLLVITRPKGGRRSLCMDMEEVKACNDLGFELEHERMLEMPSGISISASNLDTSSGGNSPIASWRISSPGDDPRDVKARLKVWAQAVAFASTSRPSG